MRNKSAFVRTVCTDFKLGFGCFFLLAVLGVTLGYVFDNWQDLSLIFSPQGRMCITYYIFNAFSFGGLFTEDFASALAALPFAANYCQELSGGMVPYKMPRCGQRAYTHSKFVVAPILGGLTVAAGTLVFMLLLATRLPIITERKLSQMLSFPYGSWLTVAGGWPYLAAILYLSFLGGALWASAGLCCSAFFPSPYVAVCAPFILKFMLTQIGRQLKLPGELRLELLLEARATIYSDAVTLIVLTAVILALNALLCHIFTRRVERRIYGD